MLKKITRMTAVAAVLTATAIAAPSAGAQSVLPAGIDAGRLLVRLPSAAPSATNPSFGLAAVAAASASRPPVAAPTATAGGFDWGERVSAPPGCCPCSASARAPWSSIRRSGRAQARHGWTILGDPRPVGEVGRQRDRSDLDFATCARSRAARTTRAAVAPSWTATPTDL